MHDLLNLRVCSFECWYLECFSLYIQVCITVQCVGDNIYCAEVMCALVRSQL